MLTVSLWTLQESPGFRRGECQTNGSKGVEISTGGDLLAVVSGNQASTFEANRDSIFV
ncbi:MAG: hypothetical protein VKL59_23950 [Nostocaceae cyanobacterium]|nr:hypothetical protein [Nostocaceae cyanobacterium]